MLIYSLREREPSQGLRGGPGALSLGPGSLAKLCRPGLLPSPAAACADLPCLTPRHCLRSHGWGRRFWEKLGEFRPGSCKRFWHLWVLAPDVGDSREVPSLTFG